MPTFTRNSCCRWPFWLLLAAWLCANSPQTLTYEFVFWFGQARHFTHQQRLHAEVASLLTGRPATAFLATADPAAPRSFAPVVPADATLKKIDLAVQATVELLPPAVLALMREATVARWPDALRAAPPHEPPRVRPIA